MAQVKGKFITLTGMLAFNSKGSIEKIDDYLVKETGLTHWELDPEEFYDTTTWQEVLTIYSQDFPDPKQAILDLGKRIYPTLKRTVGLPSHLKTPKDFILFEAEGFKLNHSSDVEPRKVLEATETSVTMYVPALGYDEALYIGVWLGILEIISIQTGKVENVGKSTYKISW
ncbi:hypothetical protein ACFQ21_02150 [Ohtaekwangia kribbensis]|jgi:hypothetical protein|uniref:Uncharacterized protein n=1 Tax=Ohtaekwangia kribbensis TaxID=688913 RepID=A0ABW3JZ50_9BACT